MFVYKYVSVKDNANGQESITEIDEVGEEGQEVAIEQSQTEVDKGKDVADTEDAVKHHHPVKEGLLGSLENEEEQISISDENQEVGKHRS